MLLEGLLLLAATVHQWWGDGESLGNITVFEGPWGSPVQAWNDADELCELALVLESTGSQKHFLGEVIEVVPYAVVVIKKYLDMRPDALHYIPMSASTRFNETDRVVHSFVCVAVRFYVSVCWPAFTADCSAGFGPVTKNSHQRVGGSVRNVN